MDYQETIDYLYSQLSVFQRDGASAYKVDLINTVKLCNALGNPQNKFKSVHIAGTNGKGSVTHSLSAIFQSAGYKCGMYTSPHLKDFSERIKINGQPVSREFIIDFVERHKSTIEKIQPSFFEVTVAMAFSYFAQNEIDVAFIETGMGGRLDSTNIIHPELSIITNVSFDHQQFLGDTLHQIAREKAGIIKENTPVVIGEFQREIASVYQEVASQKNARLHYASNDVLIQYAHLEEKGISLKLETNRDTFDIRSDLSGVYQIKNILTVLKSVDLLSEMGFLIDKKAIGEGMSHVQSLTGLKGRWQILARNPLVVVDVGHNEAGIKENLEHIKVINPRHLHIVWGMVKDKDIKAVLKLLPKDASYYFCEPHIQRGLKADELGGIAQSFGLIGLIEPDVNKALQLALNSAKKDDMILITGSTFIVAELEESWLRIN